MIAEKEKRLMPDRRSTASTPRGVKVFGIVVAVLVLLFVILLLASPDRHTQSGDPGSHKPPKHGVQQP